MDEKIKIPHRRRDLKEMNIEEIEKYVRELEGIVHQVLDFKELLEKITR